MRKSNEVSFIEIESKFDTDIEPGINEGLPWDAFKDLLGECDRRKEKDGFAFIPVTLKEQGEWKLSGGQNPSFRNENNVESISMMVFDLDDEGVFEKAEKLFSDFEHVVYSTHSYSKETPYKLRIVLPLEEEMTANQWRDAFDLVKHAIGADAQCGDLSRCYYFSSMDPDSNVEPYYNHNEGKVISYGSLSRITKKYISELPADQKAIIQDKLKKDVIKKKTHVKAELVSNGPVHGSKNLSSISENRNSNHDLSYEGFKERHSNIINSLIEEQSNYKFCRDACYREVLFAKQAGTSLNEELLAQFIVRASVEYSGSLSVVHKKGSNTMGEFANNITSTLSKHYTEYLSEQSTDYKNILNSYATKALYKGKRDEWDFPAKKATVKPSKYSTMQKEGGEDLTEEFYRNRFKQEINKFYSSLTIENRNVSELIIDMAKKDISLGNDEFSIGKLSEFAFMQLERAYIKKFSLSKKSEAISLLEEDVKSLIVDKERIGNEIKSVNDDFNSGFLEGSLKKAVLYNKGTLKRTIGSENGNNLG